MDIEQYHYQTEYQIPVYVYFNYNRTSYTQIIYKCLIERNDCIYILQMKLCKEFM